MPEIPLQQPTIPDIFSFGFDKALQRTSLKDINEAASFFESVFKDQAYRETEDLILTPAYNDVAAGESTTSTSYTELATKLRHSITLPRSMSVLVMWSDWRAHGTTGGALYSSVDTSGTSGSRIVITNMIANLSYARVNDEYEARTSFYIANLPQGTTDFTWKVKVDAGTGTWANRKLAIIPFGRIYRSP